MEGRFITKDDIRSSEPFFKQRFIYTFPDGCFVPNDIIDKELSSYHSIELFRHLRPKNITVENGGWNYIFDEDGNMIKKDDNDDYYCAYKYDCNNNAIKYFINSTYCCSFEYDYDNNLIKQEYKDGGYDTFEYKENNIIIKDFGGFKSISYPEPLYISDELMNYLKLSTFLYNNK